MPADESGAPGAGLVELHTHLEGSLTPARLLALAERHGQPGLPAACLTPDGKAFRFDGFHGFLRLFRDATAVLRTADDYRELAQDLAVQLRADAVDYAEVIVSYGVMQRRGIEPAAVQAALWDATQEIAGAGGPVLRWLPDAVRQWGEDAAWRAWEAAAGCGRALGVVGFGLGGDEAAALPGPFARICAEVAAEGLGVSIHAGEVPAMGDGGRRSVREAVEVCGARRIGHGVAAAGDPALMALLAARGVHVEVCPHSNVVTGAVPTLADHPLPALLAAGVPCSLNTDDRGFFGTDLVAEYGETLSACGLGEAAGAGMRQAAREAVFDPEALAAT